MKHKNNKLNSKKRAIATSSSLKSELQLELCRVLEHFKFNKEGF